MISILIPTYNRSDNLQETLEGYLRQTNPEFIKEIIIIDDGSQNIIKQKNENIIRRVRKKSTFDIRYLYQKNKGPAEARNYGINNAIGNIILLTGDDIVPHKDMIKEHYIYHKNYKFQKNISVLGRIEWPIGKKITPFMRYINEMGLQFGYSIINDENNVPFTFFYTSNISVQREFLLQGKLFDIEFPYAAWEDIELSYRLKTRGLQLVYNKNAIGYHHHDISFASFRKRQEQCGYAAHIFYNIHPELRELLAIDSCKNHNPIIKLNLKLVELFCLFAEKCLPMSFPNFYNLIMNHYYRKGVKKYRRDFSMKI